MLKTKAISLVILVCFFFLPMLVGSMEFLFTKICSNSRFLEMRMCVCVSYSFMSDSLRPQPGFSDHGIFQARILEWIAISCSKK